MATFGSLRAKRELPAAGNTDRQGSIELDRTAKRFELGATEGDGPSGRIDHVRKRAPRKLVGKCSQMSDDARRKFFQERHEIQSNPRAQKAAVQVGRVVREIE